MDKLSQGLAQPCSNIHIIRIDFCGPINSHVLNAFQRRLRIVIFNSSQTIRLHQMQAKSVSSDNSMNFMSIENQLAH